MMISETWIPLGQRLLEYPVFRDNKATVYPYEANRRANEAPF